MQNRKYSTNAIIEVGLMTALILVLMFITSYVPVFDILGSIILPLPITVLYVKHNFKVAGISVVTSLILISMFFDPVSALIATPLIGLLGLTAGYCLKHKKSFIKSVLYQAISMIVGTVIKMYFFITMFLKTNLNSFIEDTIIKPLKTSAEINSKIYGAFGKDMESNPAFKMLTSISVQDILIYLPAILLVSSVILAYINYLISTKVLKRFGYTFDSVKKFTHWYLDNRIGAILIIVTCLGLIFKANNMAIGDTVIMSSIFTLQTALLIDGLAVISYFLEYKFKMKKNLKVLIIFASVFLFPPALSFALFLGLFDIIMDMRKIDPNSLHNSLSKRFQK